MSKIYKYPIYTQLDLINFNKLTIPYIIYIILILPQATLYIAKREHRFVGWVGVYIYTISNINDKSYSLGFSFLFYSVPFFFFQKE